MRVWCDPEIDASFFLSVAAVLVGAGVATLRRRRRAVDARRLNVGDAAVAVGVAGAVLLVEVAVTGVGGFFGLAALGSRVLFGVGPTAVLVTGLVNRRAGATRSVRTAVGLAAAAIVLGTYGTHVEPFWLRVDQLDVPVATAGDRPVRIGVLADIQTDAAGPHERDAVRAVLDADPDIVLVAGDLFQGDDEAFAREGPAIRDLLREVRAPHGAFVVEGDVDRYDRLEWLLDGTDLQRLDDEVVVVEVDGQRVRIGGNRIRWDTSDAAAMRAELASAPDDDLVILLAHRPDAVLDLPPGSAVDLTVAGHTHGGQVVIPGFGPPVTFTDVPRHVARGGLHDVGGNLLYVSSGVGVERAGAPRLRLLSRPSVGILDLVSANPDGPSRTRSPG